MGKTADGLVRELRRFRRKVSARYPVRRMILFGSRARGEAHRFSDVDLIVVSEWYRRKDFIDRAYSLYQLWDLGYAVDFLCYTPEEFRKFSQWGGLVREALREGVSIPR